jgi:hypothetical protein
MISTIFFWFLFQFVEIFPFIDFVSFPFFFIILFETWEIWKKSGLNASHIPPTNSTRTAVRTCHSQSPRGGEGNNPKQIFVLPIYMFSIYLVIRGLILSLGKGEGYRAHTLVVEILCIPQLFNYLV